MSLLCVMIGTSKSMLIVQKDSAKDFLGIFLLKPWLTFSKHCPSKQMLSFFDPPKREQTKYLEHFPKNLKP